MITIPKNTFAKGDLVIVPRSEYESLKSRAISEVMPTKSNLRALARMRRNRAVGKLISLNELKQKLGCKC